MSIIFERHKSLIKAYVPHTAKLSLLEWKIVNLLGSFCDSMIVDSYYWSTGPYIIEQHLKQFAGKNNDWVKNHESC